MKKLFLSILFAVGFFAISQAQTLFYTANNTSAHTWDLKIGDANGNGAYHAPFTGTINGGWTNFGFQLEFGGTSSIGCKAYANLTATGGGNIPYFCTAPSNWNYSLVQVFGLYFLTINIT